MIREDCKYWQHYCDLCGITGNNYCLRKCKDYSINASDYYIKDEDWVYDDVDHYK
jgi:hypothetical protein